MGTETFHTEVECRALLFFMFFDILFCEAYTKPNVRVVSGRNGPHDGLRVRGRHTPSGRQKKKKEKKEGKTILKNTCVLCPVRRVNS
uniref:Putative secreted protein n=1 Tax=Ixodes ricinus TaxID=34613 RepID=A0A6B0UB89_IXORI